VLGFARFNNIVGWQRGVCVPFDRPLEWRAARLESRSHRVLWFGVLPIAAVVALASANVVNLSIGESSGRPEVALVVRGLANPALTVQNQSGAIARDVGVSLTLWDLNQRAQLSASDPGSLFSPAFPSKSLTPGGSAGPWTLASVAGQLEPGHVVFGNASVDCRDCGRRRTYWLYLNVGTQGWVQEFTSSDAAAPLLARVLLAGADYRRVLDELIPPAGRTPIID
jgi:hypothetical protein